MSIEEVLNSSVEALMVSLSITKTAAFAQFRSTSEKA